MDSIVGIWEMMTILVYVSVSRGNGCCEQDSVKRGLSQIMAKHPFSV